MCGEVLGREESPKSRLQVTNIGSIVACSVVYITVHKWYNSIWLSVISRYLIGRKEGSSQEIKSQSLSMICCTLCFVHSDAANKTIILK